jgi:hypothetical protein
MRYSRRTERQARQDRDIVLGILLRHLNSMSLTIGEKGQLALLVKAFKLALDQKALLALEKRALYRPCIQIASMAGRGRGRGRGQRHIQRQSGVV